MLTLWSYEDGVCSVLNRRTIRQIEGDRRGQRESKASD
jgi:hypothetical protein